MHNQLFFFMELRTWVHDSPASQILSWTIGLRVVAIDMCMKEWLKAQTHELYRLAIHVGLKL